MARRARSLAYFLSTLLVSTSLLALHGTASAAMVRPTYAVGNRWVYTLSGSIDTFPGFNGSSSGGFAFELTGRLEVEVHGFVARAVRVDSLARGYLNGSFSLPPQLGGGTASVTGTFTSDGTELWEDQGYFAIESNATTTFSADISYFITTHLDAAIRTDANTTVGPNNLFPLDVGSASTVDLSTTVTTNSTFTFLGNTTTAENTTTVFSSWRRDVVALETVRVEAGTFSSYKLNQTLGSFPGLVSGGAFAEGNETAYFSNDVGYYTKRVAYVNGTPVAETTLKSYTYGAPAPSSFPFPILILLVVAVAAAILFIVWFTRRKKRPTSAPPGGPSSERGGEHAR